MNEDEFLQQMGSRILSRRKQLDLTQEELAYHAGITSQTISTAELGKKGLRPEILLNLQMHLMLVPTICCAVK